MARNLTILTAAELDIIEAYDWYEGHELGLGAEFLRCIDACLNLIQRHPSTYQIVHETYRRATIRRFPYVVFYEFNEQEIIIYAVFHCSQDPEKWRSRLQ
ncbi:MAG: type II toxin-antitoxin system RelE/ParE family toxin [Nostoc sp. DedQUE12b]|uniref:type II toxin-antitoxin system RelE/ParE family toxin n=1 Tax=Nostoc sp. DedQUE12b TaxID=3075398 RepID=UPI002AD34BFB|nr:type II toxin-antitoxin system RelE/ParE family toxin [Nostoc sp. DedQUE12b]MDZ8085651.1 type II toxin-antitoxin system RelE/ParE family toxin [Nostoc sp. DedQUE12b]